MREFLNALWHDVLGCSIAFTLGFFFRDIVGRGIKQEWDKHIENQRRSIEQQELIADRLCTESPGGISSLPRLVASEFDERDSGD